MVLLSLTIILICSTISLVFCLYFMFGRHYATTSLCVRNLIMLMYYFVDVQLKNHLPTHHYKLKEVCISFIFEVNIWGKAKIVFNPRPVLNHACLISWYSDIISCIVLWRRNKKVCSPFTQTLLGITATLSLSNTLFKSARLTLKIICSILIFHHSFFLSF